MIDQRRPNIALRSPRTIPTWMNGERDKYYHLYASVSVPPAVTSEPTVPPSFLNISKTIVMLLIAWNSLSTSTIGNNGRWNRISSSIINNRPSNKSFLKSSTCASRFFRCIFIQSWNTCTAINYRIGLFLRRTLALFSIILRSISSVLPGFFFTVVLKSCVTRS